MSKHTKTSPIMIYFCKPWYKWSVQVKHINVRLEVWDFGYMHLVNLCCISIQASRYEIHWIILVFKKFLYLTSKFIHCYQIEDAILSSIPSWNSFLICSLVCHNGDTSLHFLVIFHLHVLNIHDSLTCIFPLRILLIFFAS